MKKRLLELLLWGGLLVLLLWALPLLIKDTGSGMWVLLAGLPGGVFALSLVYGLRRSFRPLFALLTAFLFLPTVFVFYNSSALVYAPVYGLLSLAGNGAGAGLRHLRQREKP